MKKISVLLIFMLTVMFSSTALAANGVYVGDNIFVDTDSIKRGVKSRNYDNKQFTERDKNSLSAHVRLEYPSDSLVEVCLCWIFKEDGVKKFAFVEEVERYENGKKVPVIKSPMFTSWKAEGSY